VLSQTVTDAHLSFSILYNIFKFVLTFNGGTRWQSCSRHCATRRKLAGLIPQWGHENYGSGVDAASNRNEYQGYLLGAKAAGAEG
jgi:hypothetical protein